VDLSFIKFPVSGAYPIARSALPQDVNEELRWVPTAALADPTIAASALPPDAGIASEIDHV
jgi:hypothetical protein